MRAAELRQTLLPIRGGCIEQGALQCARGRAPARKFHTRTELRLPIEKHTHITQSYQNPNNDVRYYFTEMFSSRFVVTNT